MFEQWKSELFLVTECFLTSSWRFLISNKLEQLQFKLEKIIGIKKHAGKVKKASACCTLQYFTQHSHITRKMSTFFGCRSWLHPLCAVCLHYDQIFKKTSKNCFFKAQKGPFFDSMITIKVGTHPSIFMDPFLRIWSDTIRYLLTYQFSKSQFKYSQHATHNFSIPIAKYINFKCYYWYTLKGA